MTLDTISLVTAITTTVLWLAMKDTIAKTFVYTFTREQLEAIRTKLSHQGVTLTGDEGDLGKQGVELHFKYVEPTLTITEVHKPFYVSDELVSNTLKNWFEKEA